MCHVEFLLIVTKRFYTVFLKISFLFFLGLANDFSIDSTKSILYSTPKGKDTCLKSPIRVVSQKKR